MLLLVPSTQVSYSGIIFFISNISIWFFIVFNLCRDLLFLWRDYFFFWRDYFCNYCWNIFIMAALNSLSEHFNLSSHFCVGICLFPSVWNLSSRYDKRILIVSWIFCIYETLDLWPCSGKGRVCTTSLLPGTVEVQVPCVASTNTVGIRSSFLLHGGQNPVSEPGLFWQHCRRREGLSSVGWG